MPSRRKGGKCGVAEQQERQSIERGEVQSDREDSEEEAAEPEGVEQQQKQATQEPTSVAMTTIAATPTEQPTRLAESTISVLFDEEDSYRVVCEHDEHLARIRAYTEFYDTLALLNRANEAAATVGASHSLDRSRQTIGDVNSPNPHAPSSDRTPTDVVDGLAPRSESAQTTPFTSMDREAVLASTAPPEAYDSVICSLWGSAHPADAGVVMDPRLIGRLETERRRLAQEVLTSQATIQQLQASLQAAREESAAAAQKDKSRNQQQKQQPQKKNGATVETAALQGGARPPLHPHLASLSSLSPLTDPISRVHSATPPSDTPVEDATCEQQQRQQQEQQQQHETDVDQAQPVRSDTQQFTPLPPSPHPGVSAPAAQLDPLPFQQPLRSQQLRRSTPSPRYSGSPQFQHLQQQQQQQPAKPIDVSDFFWTLQTAPPPAELHEQCGYPEHCHSTAALRSPAEGGGAGNDSIGSGGPRNYGAVAATTNSLFQSPLSAQTAAAAASTREEAVALACESAWVDSNFYCYNIMEEMSCLRMVRSWDDVVADENVPAAAVRKPLGQMTEEEVTRLLLDRTPALSPAAQSLPHHTSSNSLDANSPAVPWPTSAAVPPAGASDDTSMTLSGFSNVVSVHLSSAASQRYRLPYLQRLWVTSVLRQYLLFLLLTIICAVLLLPDMMLGTVNVFEAAEGDDFYATRNRYGRSALLVVARLGSCSLVFLFFFGFVCAEGGRRQVPPTAAPEALAADPAAKSTERIATPPSAASADAVSGPTSIPPPLSAAHHHAPRSRSIGTLVHTVLCLGAVLLVVGTLIFSRSCAARSLPFALLGVALYGGGEALVLGGVGTIASAEVGVAAGVNASLQVLLSNWLLVNAFGCFVFPKLSYYVYSPSQLLRSQVYMSATIGAFVFCLVTLSSRDLIERAAHAHAKYLSPRKLLSAARHDVSLCFYLRAATVGLLTAGVMLLLVAGVTVFVPPSAEAASVSESMKSKELMGTGTGKRSTADNATDAGLIAGSIDRWSSQQWHAPVLLFASALFFVPLCFIPRMAAVINRWCPVAILTTLLCLMWSVSTASSWAMVLGLSQSLPSKKDAEGRLWRLWIWIGEHHLLNPSIQLCGVVTGVVYTVVVSSLLRSMANAGVQLPVSHPARWHLAFHERERCHRPPRHLKDSLSPSSFAAEMSPLVLANRKTSEKSGVEGEASPPSATPTVADAYMDERMRCVRMQLRGGPAVMTVLVALLIMIVLTSCVTVVAAAAALLTDRTEKPIYVTAVMPGVTWDEHLLVKTVLTSVVGVAMLVQWVEVFHRFCSSCFC